MLGCHLMTHEGLLLNGQSYSQHNQKKERGAVGGRGWGWFSGPHKGLLIPGTAASGHGELPLKEVSHLRSVLPAPTPPSCL